MLQWIIQANKKNIDGDERRELTNNDVRDSEIGRG